MNEAVESNNPNPITTNMEADTVMVKCWEHFPPESPPAHLP